MQSKKTKAGRDLNAIHNRPYAFARVAQRYFYINVKIFKELRSKGIYSFAVWF